jgi:hypothetical protein
MRESLLPPMSNQLDLLTPHLQRQPLESGGTKKAGNYVPPSRPFRWSWRRNIVPASNKAGSQ